MPAALADAPEPLERAAPNDLLGRIRSDPASLVLPVAAALILAQIVLRGWAAAGGYFLLDDLVFVYRAVELPFDGRIFDDYNGHLMPASFALVQALTTIAPLNWGVVVGVNLLQQLAIDVVLLKVLIELFGRRLAVVVPLAVYLTSSITLPAFVWWAAALNQLPMQLAVLLAVLTWVRYLRDGRTADALRSVAALAGGLLFSEKTLLATPLLIAITLFWFTDGNPLRRLVDTARRHRTGWLCHLALFAGYAIFYQVHVESPIRAAPSARELLELVGQSGAKSVLPGLVGGPWIWEDFPPTLAITAPPEVMQWLSAVVVAVVIAVSVIRRVGAIRAWVLLGGYVAGACVLLAASRVQVIGSLALSREYRYFTDVAMVGALCLAFAFLPVRDAPTVLRPRTGSPAAAFVDRVRAVPIPSWVPDRLSGDLLTVALGTLLVLMLCAGAVVSTVGYAQRWHANPARPFIENARADLAGRPGTVLVDGLVPDPVQWHVLGPYALASRVLAGAPEVRFLNDGESAPALVMLDEKGNTAPAAVIPVSKAVPGPTENCGWLVADRPVPIPLENGGVAPWGWTARVVWLSAVDTTGWITLGDQRIPVNLPAGLREVFLQFSGPAQTATVELANPDRPVCIAGVEVGSAQPIPPEFR